MKVGNIFFVNGEPYNDSHYDLISYIPKELHYNVLKTINNYHKNLTRAVMVKLSDCTRDENSL